MTTDPASRPVLSAYIAMICASLSWASLFVAAKMAFIEVPPIEVLSVRFVIGSAILWLLIVATRQLAHARTLALPAFCIGLLEPGVASVVTFVGLTLTTAVNATIIISLMPLISLVMGRMFLKEPITLLISVGSCIAIGGTLLLVADDAAGGSNIVGDAMIFGALIIGVCGQLLLRRMATRHGRPLIVTAWQLTGSMVVTLIVVAALESREFAFSWAGSIGWQTWLVLLYLGVVIGGLAFVLYNYSLRTLPVGHISLFVTLTTPLGVVLAVTVLGETITVQDTVAIVLVLLGVALPSLGALPGVRRVFATARC